MSKRARKARQSQLKRIRTQRLRLQQLEARRLLAVAPSFDPFSFPSLGTVDTSETTAEKPQSKIWQHDDHWWSVLPNSSGTWLWRLDATTWNPVFQLSEESGVHADVKADGDLAHVLLFAGEESQFRSLEYVSGADPTYQAWSANPNLIDVTLSGGVEAATFDIDSTGRLWVASDVTNTVEVRYADSPYASFSVPITVGNGITGDDIATITAFDNNKIGVFWSDQNAERFGFRYHVDGSDPNVWSADEAPVLASMSSQGGGLADDHVNLATSADGTVYAAVKTSFDSSNSAQIGLLVRHPDGMWDPLYTVDTSGTRPIVVVSDEADRVFVFWVESTSGGDIVYRESGLDEISFGPIQVLLEGNLNDPSSTKDALTNELLVIASKGSTAYGKRVSLQPASGSGDGGGSGGGDGGGSGGGDGGGDGGGGGGGGGGGDGGGGGGGGTIDINEAPMVYAGVDQAAETGVPLQLSGQVGDDGLPVSPGAVTAEWSIVSGPSIALFGDTTATQTTVTFLAPGEYVLRLTADDGELSGIDELTIQVTNGESDPVAPISGLVGYWNVDSVSGSTVPDSSDSQNDGVLHGNPAVIPGVAGDALRLSGSRDYISVPDHSSLNPSDAITISAWIQPESKKTQYVVKKSENRLVDGYELALSGSGTSFVRFNQKSSGNKFRVESTSSYPTDGQTWVHLAATYDGETIKLYVDGQLESSVSASFQIKSNDLDLTIGSLPNGLQSMKGGIDEVRIYDQALDQNQILSLFNLENPDSNPVVNQAPLVNAGTNQTTDVGVSVQLNGVAIDDGLPTSPGGLSAQWSVVSGPGSANFSNPSSLKPTVTFGAPGEYILRLSVSDGDLTTTDDVEVNVFEPIINQVPLVDAGADQSVEVDTAIALVGDVSDDGLPNPPASISTEWTVVSGPGTAHFTDASSPETNVTFTAAGSYVLRLTVDDGELAASDDVNIVVSEAPVPNTPPQAEAGADRTVEANAYLQLQGSFTDDGLPAPPAFVTTQWVVVSGPGNVSFVDSGAPQTLVSFDTPGTYVLRLTADDSQFSDSDDVTVVVTPVVIPNTAPQVNAGADRTVETNASLQLQGSVTDDGLPAPPASVTTQWVVVSGPGNVSFVDSEAPQTSVSFDTPGTYVLRLTADDSQLTDSDDVTVVVTPEVVPNTAPQVNAGADRTVETNASLQLQGSVTDDGLPAPPASVTTQWVVVSGPGNVSFVDSEAPQTSVSFDAPGTYVLRLTANDSQLTDSDDLTVVVTSVVIPNTAPQVNAGSDRTVEANAFLQLQGSVTDDGLPAPPASVTTQWVVVSGPGNVSFVDSGALQTLVSFNTPGTYVLRLTANDSQLTDSDDVTVVVTPVVVPNTAPHVDAGSDETVVAGTSLLLFGFVSDDGFPNPPAAVTTEWSVVSGPDSVDFDDIHAAQTSATFTTPGDYVLSLMANDGEFTSSDNLLVQVTAEDIGEIAGSIGYWNMDDVAGGTADDVSGLQNDGAIQGNPGSTSGMLNGAIQLDGNGDYITIPHDSSLNVSDQITLSIWIRPETKKTQTVLKKADQSKVDGFEISLSGGGKAFVRFNQDSSGNSYRLDSSTSYPTDGETWMHVVATYDGTTIRMYINGELETTKEASFEIASNNLNLAIGAEPDGGREMKGGIDEVRIFDRALDDEAVRSLFNLETPTTDPPPVDPPPVDPPPVDPPPVDPPPVDPPPVDPPPVDPPPVDPPVNEPPQVNAGSDVTVDQDVVLQISGSVSDDGLPSPPSTVTVQWTVVSGPGSVNFSDDASVTTDVSFSVPGDYVLRLTADDGQQSRSDELTVHVNEVVVGPVEPAEGLVGHWTLDDATGQMAADSSGFDNDGNYVGNQEQIAGPVGDALRVDGNRDYVVVADDESLDISEQITLAVWIRPEATKTQDVIKKGQHRSTNGYELGLSSQGEMFVRFNQNSSSNSHRVDSVSEYPTDGETWVHVAATYDGQTIRLYVNGQLESTKEAEFQIATNDLPLTIGSEHTGFRSFKGGIDDVRIYNQALTSEQIQELAANN